MSCNSYVASNQFYKNPILKKALREEYQIFSLMGKYDYDIMGKNRDTQEFMKFFDDSGELDDLRKEIFKTNTRFMNLELGNGVAEDPKS